jgi:NTE family protein
MTLTPSFPTRTGRPRLALVLGSGGVRSVAGIGIAEALREAGLGPDNVVGCSSGALIGAPIALGFAPTKALEMARSMWVQNLTEQRRWRGYAQLVAPRLAGFDAGFSLRSDHLIERTLRSAFGTHRLEDLARPLRVAATDAASGAPVLLTQGDLVQALRASMALPFLFPSVEIDGRRLVDGVVSDPLPIGAAADADVIVALLLRGAMPRRVDRASRLVAQVSTALINNLQDARLATARAAGQRVVGIELALDRRIGLWETAAIPEIYDAGLRAARAHVDEIRTQLALAPLRRAA